MPLDPGGAGGSGSGGICSASPFDIDAKVDNLISRVDRIEQILSELLGVDITAIQLSDITQNGGTLTNLNLGSGSGVLSQIVTEIGKSNVWAQSLGNTIVDNDALVNGTVGAAAQYNALNILNYPAGSISNGIIYRTGNGFYDGGFYTSARIMMHDTTSTIAPPVGMRFFFGMHTGNFLSVAFDASYNNDDPAHDVALSNTDQYVGFQYSAPRGDSTFKIALRNILSGTWSAGIPTPVWLDTGVPCFNLNWYDMSMRCEPGSNSIQWTIYNVTQNASFSGTCPTPVYTPDDPGPLPPTEPGQFYRAGFGIWNCIPAGFSRILYAHHVWAQTLDTDTP